ncbi:MAG: helix-turn-helix domain-containing protein [Acidimicrobiales bacterium]
MDTSKQQSSWIATNPIELGRILARVRRQTGLSQEQMAARVGVHRPYLSKLEHGVATEQLRRVFAIVRETGYELLVAPRDDHDAPR